MAVQWGQPAIVYRKEGHSIPSEGVGDVSQRPTPVTRRRILVSHIPVSENRPCQKRKEKQKKKPYQLQITLRIGLPVEPMGDPGRAPRCYAQVTKSPNDHQGADIRCQSKRVFITKLELGLPPLLTQRLRRRAPNSGLHCLYRVFSREKFEKQEFPGWETSN